MGAALVGLGVALAACSGTVEENNDDPIDASDEATGDASSETTGQGGVYGPPPPLDASDEEPVGMDAVYGPPPMDAGLDVQEDAPDEAM